MDFVLGVASSLVAAGLVTFLASAPLMGRRLPFRTVTRDVRRLGSLIDADSVPPADVMIAVNRSGAIVGGILCGLLSSVRINAPCVVSLELQRRAGARVTMIGPHPPDINGAKRVLVVSCVNDTGAGLRAVLDWLSEQYGDVQTRTAAVYSNPKAIVQPDFVGHQVRDHGLLRIDRLLTAMPWMINGWRHDLPQERLARNR